MSVVFTQCRLALELRLELGASVAEVARAFEVNPNVLRRWRKEFRQGPGNAELMIARHMASQLGLAVSHA